jgi:chromosome partitioning protein
LVGAEVEMVQLENREMFMKNVLEQIRDEFDYIFIDCSPSLGLITLNALTATDSTIIPVQCEYYALEGIAQLLSTIKLVKSKLNPTLEIEGFLLTMYDSRTRLNNQVVEDVRANFRDMVFDTIIQRNIKLSEAPSFQLPVVMYDAESKGALCYMQLAKEFLDKNELENK